MRPSAAALPLHVGVAEAEGLVQALLHEVDFGAVDVAEAGAIDDDLDALILEHDVVGGDLVGIVHDVGKTRAAGLLDRQAQAHAVAPAPEEGADAVGSG